MNVSVKHRQDGRGPEGWPSWLLQPKGVAQPGVDGHSHPPDWPTRCGQDGRAPGTTGASVVIGLFLLGSLAWGAGGAGSVDVPIVFTQVPADATRRLADSRPKDLLRLEWYEGARVSVRSPDGRVRVLVKDFHSACDPAVSFDGRRILFAGKKDGASRWSIWETDCDGATPREVTTEGRDCRGPIYLSSMFTLDSPEPWFTLMFVGRDATLNTRGAGPGSSLLTVRLDGSDLQRVTFNPDGVCGAVQTGDGRVLFAGWREPRSPERGPSRLSLFGANVDGTDLELYGAEGGRTVQESPCASEAGAILIVESDEMTWDGAGQLARVLERRPHHTYRRITEDDQFRWLGPAPLAGNAILVSRRAADSRGTAGLFKFDLDTATVEPVFDSPEFHDVQARAVRARPMPDGRTTMVTLATNAGVLYALNLYSADPKIEPHLAPGTIQRVRLLEGVPAPAGDQGSANGESAVRRRLLGEAPVEPDGSFNVLVPADIPIELQALDADGLALSTCRWIWVKRRENRGCIGCHEDPELVPENTYALAVQRPSNPLTPPRGQRRSVGFREQIVPVLRARCALADCHGSANSPLPMPLGGGEAEYAAVYARLVRAATNSTTGAAAAGYVTPGQARTSRLAWHVLGRKVSRPWDDTAERARDGDRRVKQMPPPDKAASLTDLERRLLLEWIDLGASYSVAQPEISNQKLAEKK